MHWIPSHSKAVSGSHDLPCEWMRFVNEAADAEAGRQADKCNSGALLQCRRRTFAVLDNRVKRIQATLIERYAAWHELLTATPPHPR